MSERTKSSPSSVELGGEPRVNLLPPEVGQLARARSTRRGLIALVVAACLVVGVAYGAASLYSGAATAGLAAATARTQQLLTEQVKYSDATAVANLVAATTQAKESGSKYEVIWAAVLNPVSSFLPADATYFSIVATQRAPWEPDLLPNGPLREERTATLAIGISTATIFDADAVCRRLNLINGFADATPDKVELTGSIYHTTITLNVDADAIYKGRPAGIGKVEGDK